MYTYADIHAPHEDSMLLTSKVKDRGSKRPNTRYLPKIMTMSLNTDARQPCIWALWTFVDRLLET